jgi:hypothetical protein
MSGLGEETHLALPTKRIKAVGAALSVVIVREGGRSSNHRGFYLARQRIFCVYWIARFRGQ